MSSRGAGWRSPFIGVIGGVGPGATAVFMDVLVRATRAEVDQDHIDALVMQHASIPDRTAHILDPGAFPDPGPVLARDAAFLEAAGATFLVLPCNTAHHYAAQVSEATSIELVSIVEVTVRAAAARLIERGREGAPVAILATEGNVRAGVYQEALERAGLASLVPDEATQEVINAVIYEQVKAGRPVDMAALNRVIDQMEQRGAGAVILGCTELSLVFDKEAMVSDQRLVDSLRELAIATVRRAGKPLTDEFAAAR